MNVLFGHPALRRLLVLKLRGGVRRQVRKMRTWKGAILTLLGVGLFVLWIGSILVHVFLGSGDDGQARSSPSIVALAALLLTALSLSSAFFYRGLFLPKEEIERLFSAPLKRSDLIRYRLFINVFRSALGALVLSLIAVRRLPHPLFGFLGVFLAVETLPVVNQFVAILAGGLEARFVQRLRFVRGFVWTLAIGGIAVIVPLFVFDGSAPGEVPVFGSLLAVLKPMDGDASVHPALVVLTAPFEPWIRVAMAPDAATFLPWFAGCVLFWFLLVELTVRLPVDFRETSLATSASVAAKIQRARRGGGAASGSVSRRISAYRIPWLFGRGPAGAIAWRKTGAIVRKAKGTLIVSTLVLVFVTALTSVSGIGPENEQQDFAPVMIATLGTLYLCAGLRFDFRDELERMEVIKAWPLSARRLFLAMLLPEVVLVSVLIVTAILLRALAVSEFGPTTVGIAAVVPLTVLAWVALDNAVFLLSPVRFVPGQDGALQNAGRGMVMMLLRLVLLAVVGAVGGGAGIGSYMLATNVAGAGPNVGLAAAFAALLGALLLVDVGLIFLGGHFFNRFDVARDRG